ncbi:MAG: ribonuclease P protein component [Anaerolineae bacterium]|nr:ribonuclease P protein component [Anaerolineae bacterium]
MQRAWRLRHQDDFKRLREAGQSWRNPVLLLSCLPNALPHNRYGIIISKRQGTAVVRNRLRRRLRELVRALHPQLQQGYDVVVVARGNCAQLDYWALRQALLDLYHRAKLWSGETS